MSRMIRGAVRTVLVLCVVLSLGAIGVGCGGSKTTKVDGSSSDGASGGRGSRDRDRSGGRPVSEADKARLEEARKAAEAAEKELSDLRLERIRLESEQ